jgi:hypothetical protein
MTLMRSQSSKRTHGRERLVEQQDLRRGPHGPRDRDRLPLAARELLRLGVDARHAHLDLVEVPARLPAHLALSEKTGRPEARQLVPEEQVEVHGQLRDQREVLVDRLDPVGAGVLDRVEADALAADAHLAPVLLVEAAEDLDQRALAGSVVADEPEHLALAQDEVDPAEDDERSEALRDAAHLERRLGRGRRRRRRLRAHDALERAMSRSNCTFSAIAKMITTPTHT